MQKIVVIGGGILGSQIAFQTADSGFDTTIWVRSNESIKRTKPRIDTLKETYLQEIENMHKQNSQSWCPGIIGQDEFNVKKLIKKVNDGYKKLKITTNLNEALKDANIVIESMSENFDAKKALYQNLKGRLNTNAILVTNSSTMLPSKLAKYTDCPERFLALHFANSIWKNNTAEIMKQPKTNDQSFETIIKFAQDINMVPLPLAKEKSGYLLNSMLIPFLFAALDLLVCGISDVKSIDASWKLGTKSPLGPFEILDKIGLNTALNIVNMYTKSPDFLAPYHFKKISKLLTEYVEANKLGRETKEGFYKYD